MTPCAYRIAGARSSLSGDLYDRKKWRSRNPIRRWSKPLLLPLEPTCTNPLIHVNNYARPYQSKEWPSYKISIGVPVDWLNEKPILTEALDLAAGIQEPFSHPDVDMSACQSSGDSLFGAALRMIS